MAANRFGQQRLALNPQKGIFSIRLHPSGSWGPHAVSKALVRCRCWHVCRWKPLSAAEIRPLAVTSGLGCHLGAFSSLNRGSYWRWGPPRSSKNICSAQSFQW
jgi:hypothetical protein